MKTWQILALLAVLGLVTYVIVAQQSTVTKTIRSSSTSQGFLNSAIGGAASIISAAISSSNTAPKAGLPGGYPVTSTGQPVSPDVPDNSGILTITTTNKPGGLTDADYANNDLIGA